LEVPAALSAPDATICNCLQLAPLLIITGVGHSRQLGRVRDRDRDRDREEREREGERGRGRERERERERGEG